jgi:Fe(3+) dicitrate transport protein
MPLIQRIILTFLILGLSAPALFGGNISGLVLDPDQTPVARAQVVLVGSGEIVWSDFEGRYVLSNVPKGENTVRVLSDDFEPKEAVVEVNDGQELELNLVFTEIRSTSSSIEVIGQSEEALQEIPGSAFLVSKDELSQSNPIDANEVMRRVPGVNLREDSGPAAMRLNVGMRGLNPDRSRKVLMLEDGLPIALAPYGEPEMYYSPPIDRMERVEVLKGSGQIAHGPQTVGGVVNFITPDPPPGRIHGDFDLQGGENGFFAGNGRLGGSNRDQSVGWLLNYLRKQGNGWRQFWFRINDFNGKAVLKPNDRNTLAVKAGVYDEWSNSTYLGLTQPMFDQNPNQNAVPGDDLEVKRRSVSLTHSYAIDPTALLSSAVYTYSTRRFWGRQDWDRSDRGRDYLGIAGNPDVPGGAIFLRDSAGNRNREFDVVLAQTGLAKEHGLFGIRNKLDTGIRYVYEKANDKRINGPGFRSRTGEVRDDEDRFGHGFSAFVQNRFFIGDRVIFTPGLRMEHFNQERHIRRTRVEGVPTNVDRRENNTTTTALPGIGVSVLATDHLTLFGGIHRGFAPPRTKIAITSGAENLELDAELSWNYEMGLRVTGFRTLQAEVTFFRLDFQNQIITAAESGGATTTLVNGGETLHQGIESRLRVNWDEVADTRTWLLYTEFRHMYLVTAEFSENNLFSGNRLPYAPKNTFSFMVGGRQRRGFGFQLDASHIADQFGDNRETVPGSNDGTIGRLPSYTIWNLIVDYRIQRERYEISPYFTVKNLTDELYIASRAPQGIQPGLFRQVNGGVRCSF